MSDHVTAFDHIPVVDIEPFLHGDHPARAAVASEVARACETVGFLYVRGHGVEEAVLRRAAAAARDFFALPAEFKQQVHMDRAPNHRGYVARLQPDTSGAPLDDIWESYKVGFETPADDADFRAGVRFYGPNLWPVEPAAFRRDVGACYQRLLHLSRDLFRLFAVALSLPEQTFVAWTDKPASIMNVNHYPGRGSLGHGEASRLGEHTDYECFAILWQDGSGGLEVRNAAGEWIAAPPLPGTFIINIGDIMARWTNDRFASTAHRVVHTGESARQSIAFFGNCDYHTPVECLPSCQDAGNPPRYAPTTVGEHLLASVQHAYGYVGAYGDTQEVRQP